MRIVCRSWEPARKWEPQTYNWRSCSGPTRRSREVDSSPGLVGKSQLASMLACEILRGEPSGAHLDVWPTEAWDKCSMASCMVIGYYNTRKRMQWHRKKVVRNGRNYLASACWARQIPCERAADWSPWQPKASAAGVSNVSCPFLPLLAPSLAPQPAGHSCVGYRATYLNVSKYHVNWGCTEWAWRRSIFLQRWTLRDAWVNGGH